MYHKMNMDHLRGNGSTIFYCATFWISGAILICCSFGQELPLDFVKISCDYSTLTTVIAFDKTFKGVIFAEGNYFNTDCRIFPPDSGTNNMSFSMALSKCGNLIRQVDGDVYVSNNIIIQNHPIIQSDSDVVREIECELPSDRVQMQEFIRGKDPIYFSSDKLDAYMNFQVGDDILGYDISNKLMVGEEFMMVIYVKDGGKYKDFSMENCWAFEGKTMETSQYVLKIHDMYKCQNDWIFNLNVSNNVGNTSDAILYGTVKAFKFPASNNLHITCSVIACTETCNRCDPELNMTHGIIKRYKRSENEISDRSFRERHRLMKATIKALTKKLMRKNAELSENDVNFNRRSAHVELTTINNSRAHENYRPNEIIPNEIYSFNLSNSVVIFTDNEINLKPKYCSDSVATPTDCVPKIRFGIITATLSFAVFSLFMFCIGFMLHIRKEKKKHQMDNFLLYNLY